jgi:hypothetical protein
LGRLKAHKQIEAAARRSGLDECVADATVLVATHAPHFLWSPDTPGMTEPFGHYAPIHIRVKWRNVK